MGLFDNNVSSLATLATTGIPTRPQGDAPSALCCRLPVEVGVVSVGWLGVTGSPLLSKLAFRFASILAVISAFSRFFLSMFACVFASPSFILVMRSASSASLRALTETSAASFSILRCWLIAACSSSLA